MSQLQAWVRRALWDVVPRDHRAERPRAAPAPAGHGRLRRAGRGRARPLAADRPGQPLVLRRDPRAGRRVDGRRLRLRAAAPGPDRRPGERHIAAGGHADRARARCWPAVFVAGALPGADASTAWTGLEDQVVTVVDYADQGSLPLLVRRSPRSTGSPRSCSSAGRRTPRSPGHPVLWTTVAYAVATAATGNVMLTFAAVLLGLVVGLERRASAAASSARSSPTAPGR